MDRYPGIPGPFFQETFYFCNTSWMTNAIFAKIKLVIIPKAGMPGDIVYPILFCLSFF